MDAYSNEPDNFTSIGVLATRLVNRLMNDAQVRTAPEVGRSRSRSLPLSLYAHVVWIKGGVAGLDTSNPASDRLGRKVSRIWIKDRADRLEMRAGLDGVFTLAAGDEMTGRAAEQRAGNEG